MKDVFDLTPSDIVFNAFSDAKELYDNLACAEILNDEYNDQTIIEIAKMILTLRK